MHFSPSTLASAPYLTPRSRRSGLCSILLAHRYSSSNCLSTGLLHGVQRFLPGGTAFPIQSRFLKYYHYSWTRFWGQGHYVLCRAQGSCELCGRQAPFLRPDGTPYFEPHHTRRLSDGGPDDPAHVAALCPNCHKEIHYGAHGEEENERLAAYLKQMEDSVCEE